MIHWLVQTTAVHPGLARGVPPKGLLSPAEQAVFNGLRTPKRRQDWLLGRWTAKQLLQQLAGARMDEAAALSVFEILAGADGAPRVQCRRPHISSCWTISLSHAGGSALCAAVERDEWPLGADLEQVEPRQAGFVDDYFTNAEQARVRQVAGAARDLLVTAVWSAKEAALKAIHQGLQLDTRCVSCLVEPVAEAPSQWTSFTIAWDQGRLATAVPPLKGWWRGWGPFVLTLAVAADHGEPDNERVFMAPPRKHGV